MTAGPHVDTDTRAETPSVIIVIGVSGSGKTTIASALADRLGWEFQDGDWFHPPENVAKMESGTPLTDEDRWPWLRAIARWIERKHAAGEHGVVACSALKRSYRDILVGDLADAVRLVLLEGSHDLIAQRMASRSGHFMPSSLLDSQFATLERPAATERPIIVSIADEPHEIVAGIVRGLGAGISGAPSQPG